MPDLFADSRKKNLSRVAPLAVRMRPRTLEEFAGQQHFLGAGKLLRRMLEADRLTSVIFYGPPGTGKTTLAQLIASYTRSQFVPVNAAAVGVKDVRLILESARERLAAGGERTVLFLDEIHRFNRAQQDILLEDVEAGYVLLVGATTENPFFSVNSPLISRSQIFQFSPLSEEDIRLLLRRAVEDKDRGYGNLKFEISDSALNLWATKSDGDARRALSALEVAVLSQLQEHKSATAAITIDLDVAEQSIQRKAIVYDGTGDEHYDAASALIKSMRGSDPQAAVYWLARMLEAGEDPRFIARRIAILASEDIGNADPQAIQVAAAAFDIVEKIGMPEAQLTLSQAVIYMAAAPKSNASALAIWEAAKDVKEGRTIPVPKNLRDTHYQGAKQLGYGDDYQYPHNFSGGFVPQDYLGVDKIYYDPTDRGFEAQIKRRLEEQKRQSGKTRQDPSPDEPSQPPPSAEEALSDSADSFNAESQESMETSHDKSQIRRELRQKLEALSEADRQAKSISACSLMASSPEFNAARVVMLFLSTPHEIDTAPLALRCWQSGKTVVVPKVSWDQRRMLPVEITSLQTSMTTSGPGVREPVSGQPIPLNLIDLVIVPGLGFTPTGHRIGRGMGFYDRFLAQGDFIGLSCGFAYEEQIIPSLPVLDHDMPLSMLCTDRGIRRFATNCMTQH